MKKLALYVLLFAGNCSLGVAQHRVSMPFSSSYDENAWLSLGMQYNYINSTYKIGLQKNWTNLGTNAPTNSDHYIASFGAIESVASHDMSVGIPIEIRFTEHLSYIFQPSFVFINHSSIQYTGADAHGDSRTIVRYMRHVVDNLSGSNFNAFEFPFSLRFRSDEKLLKNRFNRYRGYVTAGARYRRWTGLHSTYRDWLNGLPENRPHALIMKTGYLSWEAGLGLEIFFPFFRVSPEVKFIQSTGNVLQREHLLAEKNAFMAPLSKTYIRNIQFSLIFQ